MSLRWNRQLSVRFPPKQLLDNAGRKVTQRRSCTPEFNFAFCAVNWIRISASSATRLAKTAIDFTYFSSYHLALLKLIPCVQIRSNLRSETKFITTATPFADRMSHREAQIGHGYDCAPKDTHSKILFHHSHIGELWEKKMQKHQNHRRGLTYKPRRSEYPFCRGIADNRVRRPFPEHPRSAPYRRGCRWSGKGDRTRPCTSTDHPPR